jgi:predicted chitinase
MDEQLANDLRAAMDAQHVTDNATRAGIAAICMGESGLLGHAETGYSQTPNERIRQVFDGRVAGLDDAQLNALKADNRTFFNFIYGGDNSVGRALGNRSGTDDGYDFRGRGGMQITGRTNYTLLGHDIGHPEVVDDPDLVSNDPNIGMAMSVAYIRRNFRGTGFDAMMASVGNNTADIAATKRSYFAQFMATHEFDVGASGAAPGVADAAAAPPTGQLGAHVLRQDSPFHDEVALLQTKLGIAADGNYGPATIAAVAAFQKAHGLTVYGIAGQQTLAALA